MNYRLLGLALLLCSSMVSVATVYVMVSWFIHHLMRFAA
jgi:hypothetical protein